MTKNILAMIALLSAGQFATANDDLSYAFTDKGQRFITEMTGQFGYTETELTQIFSQISPNEKILSFISRPAEKTLPWFKYQKIFSDKKRLDNGIKFYRKHQHVLQKAYEKYGVPPSIIVAILGVETRYGKVMGKHQVLRALTTIAFDYPKRERFFTKELRAFLEMSKSEGFDPRLPKGSYAGAMGMAQFMPSSFMHYAVDYDGDGRRDLWHNTGDAIFSIANYLAENGWQRGGKIVAKALESTPYTGKISHKPFTRLSALQAKGVILAESSAPAESNVGLLRLQQKSGQTTLITFNNFAVITTYNTSPMYAMAVTELAEAIEVSQ